MIFLGVKALHLIFAVSWFSGLFFLVRILIYHTEAIEQKKSDDVIQLMELASKRIQSFVLIPAVVGTFGFGTALVILTSAYLAPWFWVKFGLVSLVLAYHLWAVGVTRRLRDSNVSLSSKNLRLLNEIPFFLLFAIVFTAVFRNPFSGIMAVIAFITFIVAVALIIRMVRR